MLRSLDASLGARGLLGADCLVALLRLCGLVALGVSVIGVWLDGVGGFAPDRVVVAGELLEQAVLATAAEVQQRRLGAWGAPEVKRDEHVVVEPQDRVEPSRDERSDLDPGGLEQRLEVSAREVDFARELGNVCERDVVTLLGFGDHELSGVTRGEHDPHRAAGGGLGGEQVDGPGGLDDVKECVVEKVDLVGGGLEQHAPIGCLEIVGLRERGDDLLAVLAGLRRQVSAGP